MNKKQGSVPVYLVAAVAVIFMTGFFLYLNNSNNTGSNETSMLADGEESMEYMDAMTHEDSLVAQLEDVSGGESTGMGYILREDGKLYHQVKANMPTPDEGLVYEGWLVNQETKDFISTGVMEEELPGEFHLSYNSDEEYLGYDFVVITLETEVDDTPEEHILEGVAE